MPGKAELCAHGSSVCGRSIYRERFGTASNYTPLDDRDAGYNPRHQTLNAEPCDPKHNP